MTSNDQHLRVSRYPLLQKRLAVQDKMVKKAKMKGSGFENLSVLHSVLHHGLRLFRLKERGLQNVINFQVVERDVHLEGLQPFWHGKRILHLSDTHLDGVPGLLEKLQQEIPQLKYDMCVFTGDFRFGKGAYHPANLQPTLELLALIKAPLGIYGVLGNHDFIEQVPALEEHRMKVLLNESLDLGHGLTLIGVDDPHLYRCSDLEAAMSDVKEDDLKLLLVHSPEIVEEAERAGVDWYLCGHTHGGQISLPLFGPPFSNARCSRKFAFGEFLYGRMQGYTHNGTGASSVAARFSCPSEIVIHTLKS